MPQKGRAGGELIITQSNIYNYVKSKQDVLFLVCEHLVGMYDSILDGVSEDSDDPYTRISESLEEILDVMSNYGDELKLLYNETHALQKSDRIIILSMISRFIGRFEALLKDYEHQGGKVAMKDRRLAANLMSFVPAIVALRSWDLARHGSRSARKTIRDFILRGLGIQKPARRL